MDIGQLWITLGVNAAGLNAGTVAVQKFQDTTTTSMDRVAVSLDRTSIRFQRFGSMATMYLSLPLIAAGAGAVKLASDLELATQKTVALAGISQSQMNAWQSDIKRIGQETNRTAKEIADALYYTASAGIKSQEAMNIVELAAKGAAAGLGETDVIARFLTYSFNAYGKEALSSARVMDILSIAVREGTAEASTMVNVMGDLLPVAAAMGVPIDQVAGSLAAMTRTGFNAAKSATALRQIMVSLLHPSKEASSTLAMMSKYTGDASISVEGLRRTIKDEGLFEALIKVDKLTKQFGEATTGIVFGNVRALTGDLSLVGKNAEEVRKILKATSTETGVFENALGIMTNTMSFNFGEVKKSLENAFLGLGKSMFAPLIPIMDDLIGKIVGLTNWYNSLSGSSQSLILKTAGFIALIGPATLAISLIIRAYSLWYLWIGKLVPAMQALGVAMVANPILAVGLAIAVLTGYAIYAVTATKNLTVAQQTLNSVTATAEQNIVSEKVQMEQLLNVARSEYASKKQREEAIKSINALSPEYLGNITEETLKYNSSKVAIDKYLESLRQKAILEAAKSGKTETEKARVMEVSSGDDKKLSTLQKIDAAIHTITRIGYSSNEYEKANAKSADEVYKQRIATFDNLITKYTLVNTAVKELSLNERIALAVAKAKANADEDAANALRLKLGADADASKKVTQFIKSYNEGYKSIIDQSKVLGNSILTTGEKFDESAELNKFYFSKLEDGLKIMDKASPFMVKLIANILKAGGASGYSAILIKEMNKQLDQISNRSKVTGDSVGGMNEKLNLLTETYKKLASIEGNGSSKDVLNLKNAIVSLTNELSTKTLQKSLADAAVQSSLMGGSFDELDAKIIAHKTRLSELIKVYQASNTVNQIGQRMSALVGIQEEKSIITLLGLENVTKKYNDSLKDLNSIKDQSGISFKQLDEKIKIEQDHIEQLIAIQRVASGSAEDLAKIQDELNKSYTNLSVLQATKGVKDYSKALQDINDRSGFKGKGVSDYVQQREILQKQIEAYTKLSTKLATNTAEYRANALAIADADKALKQTENTIKFLKITSAVTDVLSAMGPVISAYSDLVGAQENRALKMVENVAKARHKSDAGVEKEKAKKEEAYAKKKKAAALAQAAVNIALGVTQALATLGPLAWVQIPLILAAGALQIATIQAQPMANGGVVPMGYNNDTYPAMLTSGETVVPPNKLNTLQNNNSNGNREKEFKLLKVVVKGRDLEYIYKEQYKLNNAF